MSTLAIFQDIGPWEIIIILSIALLLFGSKKLPDIGRSLGKGIKEFKGGIKGFGDDVREGMDDDESPKKSEVKDKADGS